MIADLAFFVVVSVAQMFVAQVWELVVLRFVLGIAIGADYPIAGALIAEHMPQRFRGAAINTMQVAWFFGAAVAYIAGYALLRTGSESWRWILVSPAPFALAGLLLRASAPESPLWLASRAEGVIAKTPFSTIFSPRYRGALAFVSAMWLLQVVPLFAIYTFAPAVLAALGMNALSSPIGSIAITMAFLLGSVVSLPLVECWGRRPLCIAGFAIGVVAFVAVARDRRGVGGRLLRHICNRNRSGRRPRTHLSQRAVPHADPRHRNRLCRRGRVASARFSERSLCRCSLRATE